MAKNPIYIPNELLISILKRLPPKTLIKFLTVSKSWYSLITSPNFITSHLNHHKNLSFFNHSFLPNLPTNFKSISNSFNGLLCLFNSKNRNLLLWNPSINKSLQIETPQKSHLLSFHTFVVLGFGYNPSNDAYKLVLIDYDHMFIWGDNYYPYSPPYAQVYSVNGGTNSGWKRVLFPDNFSLCNISRFSESCFVNSHIHWIVFRGDNNNMNENDGSILTFDPINDCFGEIKLPKSIIDPNLCLAVTNDSLVVIGLEGGEELGSTINANVWKMEEYGVDNSWMLLYQIKLPFSYDTNPNIWIKEDGKIIITISVGPLIVLNVKNGNSSSVFNGQVAMMCGEAFGFTESLVLFDRFRNSSWLQREELQICRGENAGL